MNIGSWCFINPLLLIILPTTTALGEEIKVRGADVTYPEAVTIEGKTLKLTGTGLRKKFIFNVYAIASYLDVNINNISAEGLARLDVVKRLHIIMQRSVDGNAMAEAFQTALRDHKEMPKLINNSRRLASYLRTGTAKKENYIIFDYIPSVGIRVSRTGKKPITLAGLTFAQALWDIYLGPNCISKKLKKSITERL
ncbi:MAG: chalcone isomerase family protein [Myxococcales bacterium]|nr:chalcone isomerase family protein [Myxococcales bacterium]